VVHEPRLVAGGTRAAFTKYQFYPGPGATFGPGAVYVMNADGTGMGKILDCQGQACPTNLSWSPDGTRLLYATPYGAG